MSNSVKPITVTDIMEFRTPWPTGQYLNKVLHQINDKFKSKLPESTGSITLTLPLTISHQLKTIVESLGYTFHQYSNEEPSFPKVSIKYELENCPGKESDLFHHSMLMNIIELKELQGEQLNQLELDKELIAINNVIMQGLASTFTKDTSIFIHLKKATMVPIINKLRAAGWVITTEDELHPDDPDICIRVALPEEIK